MKKFLTALVAAALLCASALRADPAPDFDLPAADGRVKLAALKGQVVYLDFWASWCAPCRKSFPWMNAMQERYGKHGFVVVAVNLDKEAELAQRFLAEQRPAFTVAYDPKGETAQRFKVVGMPSSYLIDRAGNVIGRHAGFRDEEKDKVEQSIRDLLAQQPGGAQ